MSASDASGEGAVAGPRLSDTERDEAVRALRQHCAEGRITLEEFTERMGVVLAARTRPEIEGVMADLPVEPSALPERSRPRETGWTIAVMGGSVRKGRWRPRARSRVFSLMGGCTIDLREAEIDGPELVITAVALMGGIEIVVPEGVPVELTGIPIMGDKHLDVADVATVPGAPVIRVRAMPIMGGVRVRTKRRRAHGARSQHAGASADTAGLQALPDGTVTVLFSDLAGYTALTERVGDVRAGELLAAHHALVRAEIAAHGGREVKVQGDGFMIAFDGAIRALRCAVAIQRAFDVYCKAHPEEPLGVHAGAHAGEVVRDGDDLTGRTVILARRICEEALGGEILVSALLRELVSTSRDFRFGEPRAVDLRGIEDRQTLYPLRWEPALDQGGARVCGRRQGIWPLCVAGSIQSVAG